MSSSKVGLGANWVSPVIAIIATIALAIGIARSAQADTAPNLDSNGWTILTPSANTQIVYVSSSTGNDSIGVIGDINHPFQTIAKGLSLLRNGYPDWLLLKKGDVWTSSNQITTSGLSATQPMVISSYDPAYPGVADPYTSGARPLIKVSSGGQAGLFAWGTAGDYAAIVGIEIYAHDRDPKSPTFNPSTVSSGLSGINYLSPFNWVLIEDCKVSFFDFNIVVEGDMNPGPNGNLYLRRNIVTDAYGIAGSSSSMSSGALVGKTTVTLQENLFDHNGWNTSVPNAQPSGFNHNVYIAGFDPDSLNGGVPPDTGYLSVATIKGNIFSNDSSGSQFRSGGTVDNNLFVADPYPHNIGAPVAGVNYVTNNVYLQGYTGLNTGWGPSVFGGLYNGDYYNRGTIAFSYNILANAVSSNTGIAIPPGSGAVTIDHNITFNWQSTLDQTGNAVITNDNTDTGGTNNNPNGLAPSEPFPDPTRSVSSYYASLGLGLSTDFLSAARLQGKANWNAQLMAAAVNNYIRAGFGVSSTTATLTASTSTATTGPTADTSPPSAPAGLSGTAASPTQINLSWTAATDNVGVAGYSMFRNGVQVGKTANTGYDDLGLSAGATYTYTVSAYDAAGNTSAQSAGVSVSTPVAPSIVISSPTNGSVIKGNGSVNILSSASDGTGIQSITIKADSNVLVTCTGTGSCSATWQGKNISKGTHVISATAVDAFGLSSSSAITILALR